MTTTPPDDGFANDQEAVVIVRIPEPLDDAARRHKYDLPLAAMLAARGLHHPISGSTERGPEGHVTGLRLETRVDHYHQAAAVTECLARLSAPPETRIEWESRKATLEVTLGEIVGGSEPGPG